MTPRTLLRTAALNALAAAASLNPADLDFAPLLGLQVYLGQTWPSQSPAPGAGPMPSQALIYIWDEKSETVADKTTAPKFETTAMLVIEGRVETRTAAATAALPATPASSAITGAVDGLLEALTFAIKKAICQGVGVAAQALNDGHPVIEGIKSVEVADKLAETGQRIAGNGVVTFDLQFGEYFEPLLPNALTEVNVTTAPIAMVAATPGNEGNGGILSLSVGLGVQLGIYWILLTSASAFSLTAPDATTANGTVGTPLSFDGLTLTVAAGSVAYADGDGFTVTVEVAAQAQLNLSL